MQNYTSRRQRCKTARCLDVLRLHMMCVWYAYDVRMMCIWCAYDVRMMCELFCCPRHLQQPVDGNYLRCGVYGTSLHTSACSPCSMWTILRPRSGWASMVSDECAEPADSVVSWRNVTDCGLILYSWVSNRRCNIYIYIWGPHTQTIKDLHAIHAMKA